MKVAAMTKTIMGARTASRVGTLSTSCLSFLSSVCLKPQQDMAAVKHANVSRPHYFLPRPASAYVMLTESDVKGGSHGIMP